MPMSIVHTWTICYSYTSNRERGYFAVLWGNLSIYRCFLLYFSVGHKNSKSRTTKKEKRNLQNARHYEMVMLSFIHNHYYDAGWQETYSEWLPLSDFSSRNGAVGWRKSKIVLTKYWNTSYGISRQGIAANLPNNLTTFFEHLRRIEWNAGQCMNIAHEWLHWQLIRGVCVCD